MLQRLLGTPQPKITSQHPKPSSPTNSIQFSPSTGPSSAAGILSWGYFNAAVTGENKSVQIEKILNEKPGILGCCPCCLEEAGGDRNGNCHFHFCPKSHSLLLGDTSSTSFSQTPQKQPPGFTSKSMGFPPSKLPHFPFDTFLRLPSDGQSRVLLPCCTQGINLGSK